VKKASAEEAARSTEYNEVIGTVLLPTNGSEPIPLKVEWVKDMFKHGFEVPIKKFYKDDDKCISLKCDDKHLLDNVKRNVLNKFNGAKLITCEDM